MVLLGEAEILASCLDIALETGCRAADAYYIATAKLTNSMLISNDRTQVENARKVGIRAYFLLEEHGTVFPLISGLSPKG